MARLLAIVEVEPERRVHCGAEDCNRPVYRRIHVVEEDDGSIRVLGSTCFGMLYKGRLPGESVFTGSSARQLTEAERRLLEENTEQLIEVFRRERELAREKFPGETLPSAPDIEEEQPEPGRTVKCHYCGEEMRTLLPHTPAMGFKCQECKDAGITVPLAIRKRAAQGRRW